MNLEVAKVIALSLVFVLALLFGLIPIPVRLWILKSSKLSKANTEVGLSSCVCFGAGVLFATVLLHIFPETLESFEELMTDEKIVQFDYPIGEFTICLGFFLFYFLEELIHMWVDHQPYYGHESDNHHDPEKPEREENNVQPIRKRCESITSLALVTGCAGCKGEKEISFENELQTEQNIDLSLRRDTVFSNVGVKTSMLRSIMVVAALSVHGCLEGLALGLENTVKGVWLFCMAICLHKTVISFSVGMELLEIGIKRQLFYIYIIGFSVAAPIGALVGTFLYKNINSSTNVAGEVTIVVLQAISGGAILFVVFCEVLERERTKPTGRIFRSIALFIGFVLMACLMLVSEPECETSNSNSTSPVAH